ncbi:MAG: MucB/RseB C-terminal domain-containing protein [Gammaproteobacteria bacterium]
MLKPLFTKSGIFVLAGVVLVWALPLRAAPSSAADWLSHMQQALAHKSYRGVLVFMGNGGAVTYQLVVSQGKYARMTALTGPQREILRGPKAVIRLRNGGNAMVIRGMGGGASPLPFPPATRVDLSKLKRHYALELGGSSRVAGRAVQLMQIVPRDKWRYGYRVWIGAQSGLPLRSELVTSAGKTLEQAFFTHLSLIQAPAAESAIGAKAVSILAHASKGDNSSEGACSGKNTPAFNFKQLPPGFHVTKTVCESAPAGELPVTHVLITDGLATVSLFVAAHPAGGPALVGATAVGSVHAVGRLEGSYALTAMGDVPIGTVARIAHSLVIGGK